MNMMSSTRAETFMKRLKSKKLTFSQNWFKLKSQWSKKGSSKTNSIFKTGHHKRLQMRISPHKNARARTATQFSSKASKKTKRTRPPVSSPFKRRTNSTPRSSNKNKQSNCTKSRLTCSKTKQTPWSPEWLRNQTVNPTKVIRKKTPEAARGKVPSTASPAARSNSRETSLYLAKQ